jgi:protease I
MKNSKSLLNGKKLTGKKIAILLTNGFEEVEMTKPREALLNAGAKTFLIAPEGNKVKSWRHDRWGKYFKVDKNLKNTNPGDFDAILLPGGVMNPDHLRTDKHAVKFVANFLKNNKPIAAICHGPWTLIETGKIKGMKLTSYHSIKSDLINAGAKWKNKKVVIDRNLVTSRSPKDLPAFNREIIKLFAK